MLMDLARGPQPPAKKAVRAVEARVARTPRRSAAKRRVTKRVAKVKE